MNANVTDSGALAPQSKALFNTVMSAGLRTLPTRRKNATAAFTALLLVGAAGLANATPFTTARYQVHIDGTFFSPGVINVGQAVMTNNASSETSGSQSVPPSCSDPNNPQFRRCGNAAAATAAFTDFGRIALGAQGNVFGSEAGGGGYGANASGQYSDTISVRSNTLPAGTIVQGLVELTLNAALGASTQDNCCTGRVPRLPWFNRTLISTMAYL